MEDSNKTLHLIARKLGFGDDTKILRKAAEYDRIFQTKSTTGINMSVTTKLVICLDLAAFAFGSGFDLKNAIKYSGLKPMAYTNCRKMVQNLLELKSESVTVAELCISLQCSEVQNLAEKILQEYQRKSLKEIDMHLPQYVCMAVYQACRLSKIKVSKSKLLEKSNLKSYQWAKLETECTSLVEDSFSNSTKKKKEKASCEVFIEEKTKDVSMNEDNEENQKCTDLEPYEDWKKRMLDLAYKDLEVGKKLKNKSPSKVTVKFSPYKREPQGDVKLIYLLK